MMRAIQFRGLSRTWRKTLAVCLFLTLLHFLYRRSGGANSVRMIGYACGRQGTCGGWADRQKGIVATYVMAAILGLEFKISMPRPCDLRFFFSPRGGAVDWRMEADELVGRDVAWLDKVGPKAITDFVQDFLTLEDPTQLFPAEYVFLTTNIEVVHLLQKHRSAVSIPWLHDRSVADVYRHVLTELFDLMPGPRNLMDSFLESLPSETKLVCAQVRVGGAGDTESFNTVEQFRALSSFLSPYNSSRYRLMFTSDSPAMLRHARSHFPPRRTMQMQGPVTHVDQSHGSDVCAGFGRAILEQLLLATCHVLVISESGLSKIASFLRDTDERLFLFHDGLVETFKRENRFPNRKW